MNGEKYQDPTADIAIGRIAKQERRRRIKERHERIMKTLFKSGLYKLAATLNLVAYIEFGKGCTRGPRQSQQVREQNFKWDVYTLAEAANLDVKIKFGKKRR